MKLEDRFKVQEYPAPIVVFDWMVHSHLVYEWVKDWRNYLPPSRFRELVKGIWAYWINRGPEFLPQSNWRIVIVNDYKNADGGYWRKEAGMKDPLLQKAWDEYTGEKPESTHYKGHRKGRTDEFWEIENIGKEYAMAYFPFFSEQNFEADDWAGLAARFHTGDRQMFLDTVDRDWSMLVDEDRGIYFANCRRCRPKERIQQQLVDNEAVIDHTEYKLGVNINHPRELAFAKSEKGDLGDNLPPGSPVYLFDLCEPPEEWKLENYNPEKAEEFRKALTDPKPNVRKDHLDLVERTFPLQLEAIGLRGNKELYDKKS